MEAARAAGKEVDLKEYGMLTDRLGRTLQRLGLEPQEQQKPEGIQIVLTTLINEDGTEWTPPLPERPTIEHQPTTQHTAVDPIATTPKRLERNSQISENANVGISRFPPEPWREFVGSDQLEHTARILDWSDRRR
jgi:hypothetical protein